VGGGVRCVFLFSFYLKLLINLRLSLILLVMPCGTSLTLICSLEHPVNEYNETYMISSSSHYLFEHVLVKDIWKHNFF
jgi:hypothetical protein